MTESRLLVDRQPPIVVLTLNEPDKRNPLSPQLVRELTEALQALAEERNVQAVVLTGAGTAFCAGADLREMRKATPLEDRAEYDRILALNRLLWNYPKVTVAAVNGVALGAGANVVAWCDMAIADETAMMGYPEVKAGIASATVITSLLRLVGRKQVYDLVLTGRRIGAAEAKELGLVNRVVAKGTALDEARALALEIAGSAPHALAFTKEVVRVATDMDYDKSLEYARDIRVLSRLDTEFRERIERYVGGSKAKDAD